MQRVAIYPFMDEVDRVWSQLSEKQQDQRSIVNELLPFALAHEYYSDEEDEHDRCFVLLFHQRTEFNLEFSGHCSFFVPSLGPDSLVSRDKFTAWLKHNQWECLEVTEKENRRPLLLFERVNSTFIPCFSQLIRKPTRSSSASRSIADNYAYFTAYSGQFVNQTRYINILLKEFGLLWQLGDCTLCSPEGISMIGSADLWEWLCKFEHPYLLLRSRGFEAHHAYLFFLEELRTKRILTLGNRIETKCCMSSGRDILRSNSLDMFGADE